MRCEKCGTEFEGNFCNNCGAGRSDNIANLASSQPVNDNETFQPFPSSNVITKETTGDFPAVHQNTVSSPTMVAFPEAPGLNFVSQNETKAKNKKKRLWLWIPVSAVLTAVLVVAVIGALRYFSPERRFSEAMTNKDYESAVEILSNEKLKASEENNEYYIKLAKWYSDCYENGEIDYTAAIEGIEKIKSADFSGKSAYKKVEKYNDIIINQRESFYFDVIYTIMLDEISYDKAIEMLTPFSDLHNASIIIDIYTNINSGNGVEAAEMFVKNMDAINDCENTVHIDDNDFCSVLEYAIVDNCYKDEDMESLTGNELLDTYIKQCYMYVTLGKLETDCKIFDYWFSVGKEIKTSCKSVISGLKNNSGGTGKILYLTQPEFVDGVWYNSTCSDIPLEKMPTSLEDVEYVITIENSPQFHSTYYWEEKEGSLPGYRQKYVINVYQAPDGKIIYSKEVLGAVPPHEATVDTDATKFYGDDPDTTKAIEEVKKLVGLN